MLRKLLRILAYTLLAVLALALGALAVLTLTGKGRDNLAAIISDFVSAPERQITITGLSGLWSGHLAADQVVVADAQGPWLAVKGVQVEWSPLTLLRARFDAERIAARRVELARLPAPAAAEPAGASRGPLSLPVDISIGALSFPDIVLGSEVTGGQVASMAANGRAMAQGAPLAVVADLNLSRTDGTAGEVLASIDFAPSQDRLNIDVKVSEPTGGIVANLLGLPGKPAVDLIVTGSGPIEDWRGSGTFSVDGNLVTSVSGTHKLTEAGRVVDARGSGDFARFLPERLRPLATGRTDFDLAGTLTKDGGIDISRAVVDSSVMTAGASGTFNPAGATDLGIEVTAKEGGIRLGLGSDQSPIDIVANRITLRALGDGRTPGLDISASLPSVATRDVRLADLSVTLHSDAFNLKERSGPVTGSASAASLAIDNPAVAPLVAGEIRAQLEGTLTADSLAIASATLASDAVDGRFAGDVSWADGGARLQINADVTSSALPAGARPLLGEKVALSANLERDASGNLSADSFTLDSGGLNAMGSASLREGVVDAELMGALADIAPLTPNSSGALALSATAKGPVAGPDVDLTLTSNRLAFGDNAVDNLNLRATGKIDPANPEASVTLKGSFKGEEFDGKAVLATTGGKREARDVALSLGPNRVTGNLSLDERFMPVGTLDLDLGDLGQLAAHAGQSIEGSATGTATFGSYGATPQLNIVLNSESVKRGAIEAKSIMLSALISDFLRAPEISAALGASLADLIPGQPAADIRMFLDGTLSDISGTGTVSMAGETVSSFSLTRRPSEAGNVMGLKGEGEFARFLPDRLRQFLGGKTSFDVAATAGAAGVLRIDRATIANGGLTAQVNGTYDPAGQVEVSARLDAGSAGAALSFGTDESPIDITLNSATVHAVGDINEPALDISADLPHIATNHVQLVDTSITLRSDKFSPAQRSGPVVGTATIARLVVDNPTAAPLVAGEVRAELQGALSTDAIRVDNGTLRSDAIDGGFAGSVSLTDGAIKLALKADVLSAALPAAVRPVLGEKVSLSTSLERDTEGKVSANALTLQSGGLAAQGSARVTGDQLDAEVKGTLTEVSPLAADARGTVAFSGTAKGALSGPDVALTVTSDRMTVAGRDIQNFELSASGRADLANPQANVTLKGQVGADKLDGKAVLATADGQRAVRDLALSLGQNRISGSLALDANFVPDGNISFDLPSLRPLAALALETVEGSAKGTVTFARSGTQPTARISASSAALSRADASARSVAVEVLIADYMRAPAVSGTVRAGEVRSGTTVIRNVDVRLDRDNEWTRFSGGAQVNDIPLKAAGRVKAVGGTVTVELSTAEGTTHGITAVLDRGSTIRVANGRVTLDRLALRIGGGTAVVSGTAGPTLDLNIALSRIPASLADRFAPNLGAAGTISGTVKVTGATANPTVTYSIDWGGAETAQTRGIGVGPVAVKSSGTFAAQRLTFDASLSGAAGLAIRGGGTVAVGTAPQLNLKFDGGVPFALLARQMAAQGLSLTGTANVNFAVTGTAAAPVISGNVRTSGARFIDAQSGIAVNDIAGDVGIGAGRATINRLTGSISGGGNVSATGTIGIAAGQGFPADIAIRLTNARYTDGQIVTTTFSGNVTVKGPLLSAPRVGGSVDLARTVIVVPDRLPASLEALDVRHKNAPAAVVKQDKAIRPAAARSGGGGSGLVLDLTVNAPNRIYVQGRGLDAELGGSLRLVGPVSAPQATGQFTMRRGRLALLGRRLTFTRGTLGFSGSLVPNLDLAAESNAGGTAITVLVTGPANNPKFRFSSVPPLPEDEVLARLIFGRSMSHLSALQIAQLADAAAQLAGGGGSTSLLGTLRDRLGVDDLDIRTNDRGDTTVAVGKYLNDRTYLTIEKGDRAGSGRAAIDLNIGRGVTLRGEARDDGEARGGIFLEREY